MSDLSRSGIHMPNDKLRELTVDGRGVADIRLVQVEDGPGRGQRLLLVRNGTGIGIEIALDRGFDISAATWRGINLGWNSANGMPWPAHPVDAESGVGLYRNFDGFMVTCGLDHIGGATNGEADHFIHKHRKQVFHPLHGRISSQRATLISYGVEWDEEVPIIWAEGVVKQSAVFGENLVLKRRISLDVFGSTINVRDCVTNAGFRPTSHALLYHVNFGYPFLNQQIEISGDICQKFCAAFNAEDKLPSSNFRDFYQQVPVDCHSTRTTVELHNHNLAGGVRVSLSFPGNALPDFGVWRAYQAGVYALALEPARSATNNCSSNEGVMLQAGEVRKYDISIKIGSSMSKRPEI
ncbi:aldose 1-epimerase family protein [Pseudomonas syringae]|jgi:hypothetical protein|uniref:aldose 1-epimerase family protein n=1 Tax=Pseudomonas syringae TaxID=317 RepID=UPI0006B935B6|nr:aldose 1-epimerase family protein [Pseudomonas syringae]KPB13103.1 Uncharacterized protein AC518_5265 [Pseudomonas syringae pv. syringae]MCF5030112.1 DUF4432 family protein [Pseudomonas syringae]POD19785.1 hypothetical protein BKM12_11555 [Pseudomonas syringae pv. syringae]UQB21726.1 aldose 1-epimerase family protein [Pseudomonas syringae pv. syringae]WHN05905.1 aldose 1-epimerase family protein [Pseudomonas syringae pv. syringae]